LGRDDASFGRAAASEAILVLAVAFEAIGATVVGIERAGRMRGVTVLRSERRSNSRASRRLDGGVALGAAPAFGTIRPIAAALKRPSSVRVMK
jgi:hypothetical protein